MKIERGEGFEIMKKVDMTLEVSLGLD